MKGELGLIGEKDYLEAVYKMRHQLYYTAISILSDDQDAADAVQEAMLKGWKNRRMLLDEKSFRSWFMKILVNQCRDILRKNIRMRKNFENYLKERPNENRPADFESLTDALMLLPERLRLPTLLYYFDGYTQKEIAEIVGIDPEQVKSRIRQARMQMKKQMEKGDERFER